ncbi:MAG: hypothetical protein ACR2OO_10485 [Thermomicrobiales bacterium]
MFCMLCGAALARSPELVAAQGVDGAFHASASAEPSPDGVLSGLGAGLDLPEWLQRAASETPQTVPPPAAGFGDVLIAETVRDFDLRDASPFVEGDTITSARPGRVPSDDLAAAMPDWMAEDAMQGPHPAPALIAPPSAAAADTSTFIAETDLPDWIRQLAAADAKKVEDERLAALAAEKAAAPPAPAAGDASSRRTPLPGEIETGGPGSSPWLVRRDRPTAERPRAAWGAQADSPAAANAGPGTPSAEVAARADTAAGAEAGPAKAARVPRRLTLPGRPPVTKGETRARMPSPDFSSPGARRLLLGVSVLLLILLVLVFVL